MEFDPKTHALLIQALGIEDLPTAEQETIIESSGALIYQALITRAMEEMDDKTVDEFEALVSTGPTSEAVVTFFQGKIPGFNEMMVEEAEMFMERMQEPA